jgi:hypothetical protein
MTHIAKKAVGVSWTEEENLFLIENFNLLSNPEIGVQLGRSTTAVSSRVCILRKQGRLKKGSGSTELRRDATRDQMQSNKDAVRSEVTFLVEYGDYRPEYRSAVKAGLARILLRHDNEWFWERREWPLRKWLELLSA